MKTIGRIVFGLPFGIFGVLHILKANAMAGMVPSYIPGGVFWVYLTGACLILACISIIIKQQIRLATSLLALLLVLFVLFVHLPGMASPETMQYSMGSILKDLSLAGAALFVSGSYKD